MWVRLDDSITGYSADHSVGHILTSERCISKRG